ncbi:MAG TPA: tRNA pseudouridine(55) synthase TruB [Ferruginibacter sp.]|nr:tRNA pseudouridine(55) synthase TruB [Bacteroidota bacterium]MBS1926641.1 tRNA pseudouridine(55) synthase TruB [Bacteroidota bacterium]HMT96226.1 tRNA pseudouridine(55) synthase TruB [Ferruginibacter sp.]HMU24846.1 tRNA pseudouridine(55) synthase TruB [Ferruginibacter sp.]
MAKKESYRKKHQAKISPGPSIKVSITDEKKKEFEEGRVLFIDKELHWTSFDVVRKIRNSIGIKKVGHAGTLDPLATGLLIVCTGKSTKQINGFMAAQKEYTGSFTLGAETPTYDLESEPVNFKPYQHLSPDEIQQATKKFTGEIFQVPPIYSAIKKDGEALYHLARRGEDVELQPRKIMIHHFEITAINLPEVYFKVQCSTGTYIRSLAHDFGQALACGAYLGGLRRTQIGEHRVENAQTIGDFLHDLSAQQ